MINPLEMKNMKIFLNGNGMVLQKIIKIYKRIN